MWRNTTRTSGCKAKKAQRSGIIAGMVLDYRNGEFVFECTFEERHVPKLARFWWNPRTRQWVSQSARCAIKLREYATQAARARIVDTFARGIQFRDSSMSKPPKTGRFMKVKRA